MASAIVKVFITRLVNVKCNLSKHVCVREGPRINSNLIEPWPHCPASILALLLLLHQLSTIFLGQMQHVPRLAGNNSLGLIKIFSGGETKLVWKVPEQFPVANETVAGCQRRGKCGKCKLKCSGEKRRKPREEKKSGCSTRKYMCVAFNEFCAGKGTWI